MQVLLVTGGRHYSGGVRITLDSTEVLDDMEAGTWRLTAPLPSARYRLRAAVVNNNIFVFGENNLCYINIEHLIVSCSVYNGNIFTGGYNILQYNTASHTWEEVGQMKEARVNHAVTVLDDVTKLCP